jgi:hypothetical protein
VSKRECTDAERELIEACACLEVDAAPTNEEHLRYRAAHQAVRAERQPKDPVEVFISEMRDVACVNGMKPNEPCCIVSRALAKLDAARKEKP